MVKAADDRALTLAAVSAAHAAAGIALIAVSDPPALASWPSVLASTAIHYAYYALLFSAYRLGDLSQVYPISRGMAPALVAVGTFLLIGETMSLTGWGGLGLVTLGIGTIAFQRGAAQADRTAIGVAALLGLAIAAYSVADGIGVRLSESPTGYMGWLFLLEAPVPLAILWRRRAIRNPIDWRVFVLGLVGGVLSVTAYGLVLYAKTIAPIAAVSAVRESSVIIAALIGVLVFGERPWQGRVLAALLVAAGVVVLATSG
ncbi:EamA family transporter [Nitratireductor sp. CAU 1489]|uniref:EamA family transporter n=2 Tax=Nitratireductor arenosus TaxID=2682096 RepID=A0A844QJ60_9HYPH|nr:EamA family transporter [Nitratireductor arenosus]